MNGSCVTIVQVLFILNKSKYLHLNLSIFKNYSVQIYINHLTTNIIKNIFQLSVSNLYIYFTFVSCIGAIWHQELMCAISLKDKPLKN